MNKLLIIMDDWEKLERYEERFRPHFEVFTAPQVAYGLEIALEQKPDVILACLAFESVDERTLQIEIRDHEQLAQIPLVFLSEEHGEDAVASPIDIILPQPAHFDTILAALQSF